MSVYSEVLSETTGRSVVAVGNGFSVSVLIPLVPRCLLRNLMLQRLWKRCVVSLLSSWHKLCWADCLLLPLTDCSWRERGRCSGQFYCRAWSVSFRSISTDMPSSSLSSNSSLSQNFITCSTSAQWVLFLMSSESLPAILQYWQTRCSSVKFCSVFWYLAYGNVLHSLTSEKQQNGSVSY